MGEETVTAGLGWPHARERDDDGDESRRVVAGLGWPVGRSCEEHGVSRETGSRAASSDHETERG